MFNGSHVWIVHFVHLTNIVSFNVSENKRIKQKQVGLKTAIWPRTVVLSSRAKKTSLTLKLVSDRVDIKPIHNSDFLVVTFLVPFVTYRLLRVLLRKIFKDN